MLVRKRREGEKNSLFEFVAKKEYNYVKYVKEDYHAEDVIMTRKDNVLNMQITIANCMKQEWDIDFNKVSDMLDKYDLLSYIDICYETYNSMGIQGILQDLKLYINAIEEAV